MPHFLSGYKSEAQLPELYVSWGQLSFIYREVNWHNNMHNAANIRKETNPSDAYQTQI